MSEMVERMACAMMNVDFEDKIKDYYKMARAALAAMREPTEAIIQSWDTHKGKECNTPETAKALGIALWQSSIDAALSE